MKSYAEAKAAEADALIEKDTLLSGKAKTRVSDLSAAFLAEYQKTHKPSSVYSRWNQMKNHILPAMGNYTVEKLTNDDLDSINERLNKGPKTSLGALSRQPEDSSVSSAATTPRSSLSGSTPSSTPIPTPTNTTCGPWIRKGSSSPSSPIQIGRAHV